jgi:hypothetical protein
LRLPANQVGLAGRRPRETFQLPAERLAFRCDQRPTVLASMRSKGRPRRPGLKARDPTWTAQ